MRPHNTFDTKPSCRPQLPTLNQDEIDAAHGEYMRAIVALFEEHKVGLGYGDRQLTLV